MRSAPSLFEKRESLFSPDHRYRYRLSICWEPAIKFVNFLMLNPSTADEFQNDPTVSGCIDRARFWGYGGIIVTNLFARCATNPDTLFYDPDPIGSENDAIVGSIAMHVACAMVVCGWGSHKAVGERGRQMVEWLRRLPNRPKLCALHINSDGNPGHPLYLPRDLKPEEFSLDTVERTT